MKIKERGFEGAGTGKRKGKRGWFVRREEENLEFGLISGFESRD